MASRPHETLALCWVTTPDAASWGPPLIDHVGETVTAPNNRDEPRVLLRRRPAVFKKSPGAIPEIVRSALSFLGPRWQGFMSPSPLVKRSFLPEGLVVVAVRKDRFSTPS